MTDERCAELGSQANARRLDWVRHIRRLLEKQGVLLRHLAVAGDHQPSRVQRMLDDGARESIPLRDLDVLVEFLGPEVLEPVLKEHGCRIQPMEAGPVSQEKAAVAAMRAAREAAEAGERAVEAMEGGLTHSEWRSVLSEINDARRALDALEATVNAAVVVQ